MKEGTAMSETIAREVAKEIKTQEIIRFRLAEIPESFQWISILPRTS